VKKYKFSTIDCVQWNPNKGIPLLAVVHEKRCTIIAPHGLYNDELTSATSNLLTEFKSRYIEPTIAPGKKAFTKWIFTEVESEEYKGDIRLHLEFEHILKRMRWHSKGDYFATLADNIQTSS